MRWREVSTPDDRMLEVVEDGDPSGIPLVVHHGTPGAAGLHPDWVADAQERGLRLVSYSRPGYGGSTHPDAPLRTLPPTSRSSAIRSGSRSS